RLTDSHRNRFRPPNHAPVKQPFADGFSSCLVVTKHFIEMTVVHVGIKKFLEDRKFAIIADKPGMIELLRSKYEFDFVVVSMQPSARVPRRNPANGVGGRKRKPFADRVHESAFRPTARQHPSAKGINRRYRIRRRGRKASSWLLVLTG